MSCLGGCTSPTDGDQPEQKEGVGAGGNTASSSGGAQIVESSGGTDSGGSPAEEIPEPTEPPPGYPAGPYGDSDPEVGDTLENLTFEGFARIGDGVPVHEGEIETFTLAEIRDAGEKYALLHTATIWCPSCRTAADDLALQADEVTGLGATLIELVLEGDYGALPTDEELSLWAETTSLSIMTVRPGDARTPFVFPSREYVYLVELETMEIVWAEQALFSDPSITEQGLAALRDLL